MKGPCLRRLLFPTPWSSTQLEPAQGKARQRRVAAGTSAQRAPRRLQEWLAPRHYAENRRVRRGACASAESLRRRDAQPRRATARGVRCCARGAPWPPPSSLPGRPGRLPREQSVRTRVSSANEHARAARARRAFVVLLLSLLGRLQGLRLAAVLADHGDAGRKRGAREWVPPASGGDERRAANMRRYDVRHGARAVAAPAPSE